MFTPQQDKEFEDYIEYLKGDILGYLPDLIEALENSKGTELTEELRIKLLGAASMLTGYSDRTDKAKNEFLSAAEPH